MAARYARHAQLETAVIAPELGGKINFRFALRGITPTDSVWGAQLVHEFETWLNAGSKAVHVAQASTRIERTPNDEFSITLTDQSKVVAKSVIITTGAAARRLFVPGEKEYWGRGVSFSAISHAPLFINRDVAVIGNGGRALIATLGLAPLARRVYLIVAQRSLLTDHPAAALVRRHPNVSVFSDWEVQAVTGDDFVTGIQLVGANGETRNLAVEGVFVQFALLPNNELVRGLVELDEDGHICVNQRCETTVPGLFAAGDVTNIHAEQVLVAVGEGAKAGLSAWEYLATRLKA